MPELTFDDTGVLLAAGGEDEPETLTPAQARDLADGLLMAADAVDDMQQTNRERCAREGHDWFGFDTRRSGREVFLERCERPGCDAEQESDGWRDVYPPKTHHVPVGFHVEDRECYGPGCHWCLNEEMSAAFHTFLDAAGRDLDETIQKMLASPPRWPIPQTDDAEATTAPSATPNRTDNP